MKKKDFILIIVIILISCVVYFGYGLFYRDEGNMVEVRIDREVYGVYPLFEDKTIMLELHGSYNEISIFDGTVKVTSADCKDQTCVNQKEISMSGETIICLPNRVTITILSKEQTKLDGVSY